MSPLNFRIFIRRLCWATLGVSSALVTAAAHGDTLRLQSGEVLIGTIVSRTPTEITFDSKALGRISVPAAGVEIVGNAPESAGTAAAPAAAPSSTRGTGAAPAPETKPWVRRILRLPDAFSGSIETGVDSLNADVRMRDYIVEASFGWKDEKNEVQTHSAYEKMTVDGFKVTDTHDESLRYIRRLGARWVWLSQADWRHDTNQGIAHRLDLIGIPGFYLVKNDRLRLLAGIGPSYEWRKWDLPGATVARRFNAAGYELFNVTLTPTLSFRQTFLGYVDPKETDETRYVFEAGLIQRLSAGLSLILTYNRRFESNPPPRAVENRERVLTKLGYEF